MFLFSSKTESRFLSDLWVQEGVFLLTDDCLKFCLPVVSPDRAVVLYSPDAGIGAMCLAHPVTQWWRERSASSESCLEY